MDKYIKQEDVKNAFLKGFKDAKKYPEFVNWLAKEADRITKDMPSAFDFTCANCFNPSFSGYYLVYMYGWNDNGIKRPFYIWYYDVKRNEWCDEEGSLIDKYDEFNLYWCSLPEVNTYMHDKKEM
jgi:hypothetical protein